MRSRLLKSSLILVITVSILIVVVMVSLIVQNYTDTKQWDINQLGEDIHNVPPQLAKNYVSLDDQHLLELLSSVNGALAEIEKNGGIDPDSMGEYNRLYESVSSLQEELALTESELTKPAHTLGLYIDIEQAIKSAYTKPNPKRFAELADRLSERLLSNGKHKMDNVYLEALTGIADQYQDLDEFVTYSLGKLGELDKGQLTVSPSVTKELTNDMVSRIDQNKLHVFKNVQRLKELLTDPDWEKILQHASAKRERDAWHEAKSLLESLSKSDYVSASTFQTYEDVVNFGYNTNVPSRQGYDIDMKSRVTSITVNGQPVPDDAYFKKHSSVYFTFDVEYTYREPEHVEITVPDFSTDDSSYDSNDELQDSVPPTDEDTSDNDEDTNEEEVIIDEDINDESDDEESDEEEPDPE